MVDQMNPQQGLADKEKYYEEVTRTVRWVALFVVVVTFPPSASQYHFLLLSAFLAAGFNGLRYTRLMRWRLFSSRVTTLIADNALIGTLIGLSGGIHSPYILFWVFTVISSAYWYGRRGNFYVVTYQVAITGLLIFIHSPTAPTDIVRVTIAEVVSLIGLAYLAERLTHVDRNERQIMAQANRQTETERQRLLALINSLVDPVVAINTTGNISVYNGAALDLLNTNKQLAGQNLNNFIHLVNSAGTVVPLASILGQESVVRRTDLLMQLDEDSILNLDISVAPIYGQGVAEKGYLLILRDITKQKSLDQERDEFIAVTSHELRTPIAIAEANLSTALLPKFDTIGTKARGLITQAHQNIIFLGQLIADLSTLSKAEQNRLDIQIEKIDPASLVNQLAEDYRASAEVKKLTIKVQISPDLQPISSSLNLVHEILQNFLTNAIKYTQKGTVTLAVTPSGSGKNVTFSVSDSGIGVSASDKKKLFTKFYRSEDYRTRQTSGTGLGLYITLRLAQRLGGQIIFKSKLNVGSTFSLELPVEHVQPHAVSPGVKPLAKQINEN